MPVQTEFSALLTDLAAHLQEEGVCGLPREWFACAAQKADRAEDRLADDSAKDECPPQQGNQPGPEPAFDADRADDDYNKAMPAKGTRAAPQDGSPESYAACSMEDLSSLVLTCRKCRLCEGRNKTVFGVGCVDRPPIVFVGEGPGADEDRVGEPFVGRAGALLTGAITKGMGLTREKVYICNVVKCRPPNNRAPLPDETAACTPYLYRQLEILRPGVIVALGSPAQLALTGQPGGITRIRGKWLEWRGMKVMPTFHPAYLLRNPAAKRDFWEDLKAVMVEAGLTHSRKGDEN